MNFISKLVLPPCVKRVNYVPLVFAPPSGQNENYLGQRHLNHSAVRLKTFEPDYLDAAGQQIPTYPPLNIQVGSNAHLEYVLHKEREYVIFSYSYLPFFYYQGQECGKYFCYSSKLRYLCCSSELPVVQTPCCSSYLVQTPFSSTGTGTLSLCTVTFYN